MICKEVPDKVKGRMSAAKKHLCQKIKRPRDVIRYINSFMMTYSAVSQDVDAADFVLLEFIRMYYPKTYSAIRANKNLLVKPLVDVRDREVSSASYDETFVSYVDGREREKLKKIMRVLFPTLDSVWSNSTYDSGYYGEWASSRRVVTDRYFENYFQFFIGEDIAKKSDLDLLISGAGDVAFVKRSLMVAREQQAGEGATKVSVLLEELEIHSKSIAIEKVESMLSAIFEIAEKINAPEDRDGSVDNILRIHWLMRSLTLERMTLKQRSEIIFNACNTASMLWLAHLARSAFEDHNPAADQRRELEENCLLTEHDATELKNIFLRRIKELSETGLLINHPYLARLLYTWNALSDEGEVNKWLDDQLARDESISKLVEVFIRRGWHFEHHSPGVRTPLIGIDREGMSTLVDVARFRARIEEIAAMGRHRSVTEFLELWRAEDARSNSNGKTSRVGTIEEL